MKLVTLIANLLDEAWSSQNEDVRVHRMDLLDDIETSYLPSGSGFDSWCEIMRDTSGNSEIRIKFSYNVMNDAGYYTRWIHTEAIVKALLTTSGYEIRLKNMASFKKDMVDDYVLDTLQTALDQEVERIHVRDHLFKIGRLVR